MVVDDILEEDGHVWLLHEGNKIHKLSRHDYKQILTEFKLMGRKFGFIADIAQAIEDEITHGRS